MTRTALLDFLAVQGVISAKDVAAQFMVTRPTAQYYISQAIRFNEIHAVGQDINRLVLYAAGPGDIGPRVKKPRPKAPSILSLMGTGFISCPRR